MEKKQHHSHKIKIFSLKSKTQKQEGCQYRPCFINKRYFKVQLEIQKYIHHSGSYFLSQRPICIYRRLLLHSCSFAKLFTLTSHVKCKGVNFMLLPRPCLKNLGGHFLLSRCKYYKNKTTQYFPILIAEANK